MPDSRNEAGLRFAARVEMGLTGQLSNPPEPLQTLLQSLMSRRV
jgi:hypothetical protein